jgi:4-hydroxy-3-polyprenylbenzoate decarboxylase
MEHSHESAKKLVHKAKEIIYGSKPGVDFPKAMLVDNDIDPSDIIQVIWAFATRVHPQNDAHFYIHEKTLPLIHYLNAAEKKDMSSTKVIFDALLPNFDRTKIASFEHIYPKELQEKVVKDWGKYGYGK